MRKAIHIIHGVSIGTGMAFAASCFAMAGALVDSLSHGALWAVAMAAVLILVVAYAVGRLARRFPSAMGIRTYVKAAFGNGPSLFVVFAYLFMIALVGGVEAVILAKVVTHYLPQVPALVVIVALVGITAGINVLGMAGSRNIQTLLAWSMIAGIAVLSTAALNAPPATGTLTISAPAMVAWPAGVIGAFFLFVGFEWVTTAQSGSRDAASVLPLVLILSVLVLAACYMGIAAAFAHALPAGSLHNEALPQLMLSERLWATHGGAAAVLLCSLSALTSFNAGMMGAARMLYALARERYLPAALLSTHARTAAPTSAIAAISVLTITIGSALWLTDATLLVGNLAAILICLCYVALMAALIRLERTQQVRQASTLGIAITAVVLLLTLGFLTALVIESNTRIILMATAVCLLPIGWYCRRLTRPVATP